MKTALGPNSLTLTLAPGEVFFFKGTALRGFAKINWPLVPRFARGSPISRLLHSWYFGMRKVSAQREPMEIPLKGVHPRGDFFPLTLKPGERVYVSAHAVAGFCGSVTDVHTSIHLTLSYWLLRKLFFSVFTGPGLVLIYSRSPIEETAELTFSPDRIIAFDAERRFRAAAPEPSEAVSQVVNIFSREVLWKFIDGGQTVAERHVEGDESDEEGGFFFRLIEHALAFLRF